MLSSTAGYSDLLIIEPKRSMQLLIVLFGSHLASVVVVLILVRDHWFIQLVIVLLIGFSWFYYYRLYGAKVLRKSVLAAYHHQDQGWSISISSTNNKQGSDIAVTLLGSSYASQWWVVLNFHHAKTNSHYTLLVPADSVSAEVHRQLRVRLKIMG